MTESILSITKEMNEEIIEIRRYLHQNPELSNEEYDTSIYIQRKLEEFNIPYRTGFAKTGVLGIIKGRNTGKTVALRADMDALPIQEKNDVSFKSKKTNIMHACGHDAHMAMLLIAGKILNKNKDKIYGTVLLVFQPAEENAPYGGAEKMMRDGVFDKYQPDVIFGQHVWPQLELGEIGVIKDTIMGTTDRFKITINGTGGHASMPHQTTDAIVASGYLVTSLQTIVSRRIDPLQTALLTIGTINGGSQPNIIPESVTLSGSIRALDSNVKKKIEKQFMAIVSNIASTFEVNIDVEYKEGYPPTVNNRNWTDFVKDTAVELLGDKTTPEVKPSLGAEDFSRFTSKYPGVFFWLGTQLDNKDLQRPIHDANFQLNENALHKGCALFVQLAIKSLATLK